MITFDLNPDSTPRDILEPVFEMHYRVIAASNERDISYASSPVYRASRELVQQLMRLVFGRNLVETAYEIAITDGELPSLARVHQEYR